MPLFGYHCSNAGYEGSSEGDCAFSERGPVAYQAEGKGAAKKVQGCGVLGQPAGIAACGWEDTLHPEGGGEPRDWGVETTKEPPGPGTSNGARAEAWPGLQRSHVGALPEKQRGWSGPLLWRWGPASSSICLGLFPRPQGEALGALEAICPAPPVASGSELPADPGAWLKVTAEAKALG